MAESYKNLPADKKQEVIDEVKRRIELADIEEFILRISKKCFVQCVIKPGPALGAAEKRCASMCMDRYVDSWNLVMRTYVERVNKESEKGVYKAARDEELAKAAH